MSHDGFEDRHLEKYLPEDFRSLKVMDVGHGKGKTGFNVRAFYSYNKGECELYGMEAFEPFHNFVKQLGLYDYLDLQDATEPWSYPPKYFNISIAQHVIEHLPNKESGRRMLKNMEYHTKGLVIVVTPLGFVENKGGDTIEEYRYMKHRVGWSVEDFEQLGYSVELFEKPQSSRAVKWFHDFWYRLRRSNDAIIIAWKDMKKNDKKAENVTPILELEPPILENTSYAHA
jgi:hypothetical protein